MTTACRILPLDYLRLSLASAFFLDSQHFNQVEFNTGAAQSFSGIFEYEIVVNFADLSLVLAIGESN